ncbi:MAG TPA: hypothetical protein VKB77_04640 [Terriglobales bacterium]|nr:hypothetical protein [Terriglobales bacterium]
MSDRNARRHGFQVLKDLPRRIFRRKPRSPGDPYADLLVPVRRCPSGRSGAAVAEAEEDTFRVFPLESVSIAA